MILYHCSPFRIRGRYVRTEYALTRLPVVWACLKAFVPWACEHVLLRHSDTPQKNRSVYIYTVEAPRSAVIRFRGGIRMIRTNARIIGRQRISNPLKEA